MGIAVNHVVVCCVQNGFLRLFSHVHANSADQPSRQNVLKLLKDMANIAAKSVVIWLTRREPIVTVNSVEKNFGQVLTRYITVAESIAALHAMEDPGKNLLYVSVSSAVRTFLYSPAKLISCIVHGLAFISIDEMHFQKNR
jgi:hypothetical protein